MLGFDLEVGKLGDDGLHGNGVEPLIGDKQHVLCEIEIFRRKRAAHVIALFPAQGDEFFDVADDVIEAALAVHRLSDRVVHFFSAVEGKNDVFHFLVEKFNRLVV